VIHEQSVAERARRLLLPLPLGRYERLRLHVRPGFGDRPGERRVPGRPQPTGVEVEAHAGYAPGDDLRHLDWNALARLDTLLVRRFTAEREVAFHLLVDCSASMDVPARDRKLALATELALALAAIAFAGNDAVRVALLHDDEAPHASPLERAGGRERTGLRRVAERLAAAEAVGSLALGAALAAYARRHRRAGAVIVISDLMSDPEEIECGVQALRARRYEVLLLHVIARGELEPERDFTHGLLHDVESDARHAVTLSASALARYRDLLAAHLAALQAMATRNRAVYARLASDTRVEDFMMNDLARLGVVRRR
jgi:uncharacterized protein (DUF58 family)